MLRGLLPEKVSLRRPFYAGDSNQENPLPRIIVGLSGPAFYRKPRFIEDIIDHTVGKVLDQFGITRELFSGWGGA